MARKEIIVWKRTLKIVLITPGGLIILCVAAFLTMMYLRDVYKASGEGLTKISYSEEFEPLEKWIPNITGVKKIYWKDDSVGRIYFKSNYYITGFIVLKESEMQKYFNEYGDWEEKGIEFPEGLDPKITGYNNFDWQYSYDCSYYFSREILKPQSYGEVYFDFTNNIIYFEYMFD